MASTPTGQAANDDYFDITKFEQLLEGRRDIFATGLAGMMGNFW